MLLVVSSSKELIRLEKLCMAYYKGTAVSLAKTLIMSRGGTPKLVVTRCAFSFCISGPRIHRTASNFPRQAYVKCKVDNLKIPLSASGETFVTLKKDEYVHTSLVEIDSDLTLSPHQACCYRSFVQIHSSGSSTTPGCRWSPYDSTVDGFTQVTFVVPHRET